jgi:hypothetical protein
MVAIRAGGPGHPPAGYRQSDRASAHPVPCVLLRFIRPALALLAACLLAEGCRSAAPRASTQADEPTRVDSVSLERTRCYGTCPTYRVVLTRDGDVRFTSGDARFPRTAAASFIPASLDELAAEARVAGFWSLPARIADQPALCGARATDFPSAIVTVFTRAESRAVEDYRGCHGEGLERLRRLEEHIDSVAGSGRWLRRR